jgi:hypothetical protein
MSGVTVYSTNFLLVLERNGSAMPVRKGGLYSDRMIQEKALNEPKRKFVEM